MPFVQTPPRLEVCLVCPHACALVYTTIFILHLHLPMPSPTIIHSLLVNDTVDPSTHVTALVGEQYTGKSKHKNSSKETMTYLYPIYLGFHYHTYTNTGAARRSPHQPTFVNSLASARPVTQRRVCVRIKSWFSVMSAAPPANGHTAHLPIHQLTFSPHLPLPPLTRPTHRIHNTAGTRTRRRMAVVPMLCGSERVTVQDGARLLVDMLCRVRPPPSRSRLVVTPNVVACAVWNRVE